MNEILSVWGKKRQWRVILLTAIVYAVLLVPLKPFAIVPGYTELRLASFVPVLFGVLFGPAAAWGAAFGNLGADFFGTLGPGSLFGFIANFLFAYVPYKVWELLREPGKERINARQVGHFVLAALAGSAVCGLVIGAGLFMLGLQDFQNAMFMVMIITLNNAIVSVLLGSAGLWLLREPARRAGLLYDGRAGASE
ncbi:MAG: QueT transporter family protein [Candidatus Marsarchaeota archaeon]|nr:QueT transporter family protein [Candidatus Marsarchaeota archaeon]